MRRDDRKRTDVTVDRNVPHSYLAGNSVIDPQNRLAQFHKGDWPVRY
jgi:hypothetical protein